MGDIVEYVSLAVNELTQTNTDFNLIINIQAYQHVHIFPNQY